MNTKKLKKHRKRIINHTKKNKNIKRKNHNGGGFGDGVGEKIKEMPGKEGDKMKMRASALKNPIKDAGKGAIASIITMENPIVFAYQLIEKHIFGWDVEEPERKMSETQKKIFGDSLVKKNKRATLKEFMKGEFKKPQETDQERAEREAKEKKEEDERKTLELIKKIQEAQKEEGKK